MICGSVALDTSADELSKRLAHSVYDKCRAGSLSLQGFPCFDPLVQALRNGVTETNQPEYQVCAPVTSLQCLNTAMQSQKNRCHRTETPPDIMDPGLLVFKATMEIKDITVGCGTNRIQGC